MNPKINAWYVLELSWSEHSPTSYHLVNARPAAQDVMLDADHPGGLVIASTSGREFCELWSDGAPLHIEAAARSSSPYVALCGEEITLRLRTPGRRTTLEWATDFLRDNIWGGEQITVFVRERLFKDAYLDISEVVAEDGAVAPTATERDFPSAAQLNPSYAELALASEEIGLSVEGHRNDVLVAGRWYRARENPGLVVSVVRPNFLASEILGSHRDVVSALDAVENEALIYLVAFDLDEFDLGFALGTEHPRVEWSERVPPSVMDASLPGPDGIGDLSRSLRRVSSRGAKREIPSPRSPEASNAPTVLSSLRSSLGRITGATTVSSKAAPF